MFENLAVKEKTMKKLLVIKFLLALKNIFNNRTIVSDILDMLIGELNSDIMKKSIYNQKTCGFGRKVITYFLTAPGVSLDTC